MKGRALRWSQSQRNYVCADGTEVAVQQCEREKYLQVELTVGYDRDRMRAKTISVRVPRHSVAYVEEPARRYVLASTDASFNRNLSYALRSPDSGTTTFSSTVTGLSKASFETLKNLKAVNMEHASECFALSLEDTHQVFKDMFVCSRIRHVHFPEGMNEIGVHCFSYSCITSVVIPKSVRVIRYMAFMRCARLKRISFSKDS